MKKWIAIALGCALLLGGFSYIARAASSDDTGVLLPPSPNKVTQKANIGAVKCEDAYAKAAGALIGCYAKCDKATADLYVKKGTFAASPKDEEGCEAACTAKYNTAITKAGSKGACPPCLNATTLYNSASTWAEGNLDRYCDSSSPAIPFP